MGKRDPDRLQHLELAKAKAKKVGANVPASLVNAARDYDKTERRQKQRAKRTKRLDDLLNEPAAPSFLDQLMAVDAAHKALDRLDDTARAAVILRYLEGRSRTAICAILNLPEEATKTILKRAIKRMQNPV